MKTIKPALVAIAMLVANITLASDGHIQKDKIEKTAFLQNSACMTTALAQVTVVTDYAYQQMLLCGPAPSCTQLYNTLCNNGFAYVENSYFACIGGGNALTADSPLYKAQKSK